MSFLELKDIHKSYYLGKEEFPVLKGIDLEFNLGEFVSILGESGGGKSTLMNIIGGLDRKFNGSVVINGQKLNHSDEKALDSYRRDTIGYIYQAYNLINHLSILDNVLIPLDMTTLNKSEREAKATELLTRVGLSEQIHKYPSQLSGGQKQRVAIARALASDPKVIIADEPTGALDAENTQEVLQILNEIAEEGRLVIAVTHSQTVADAGTRIVHMVDGKIEGDTHLRDSYEVTVAESTKSSRLLPASVSYKTAYKHLMYNKWRNSLIVVGTAIGLFAVMLFSGLGNGISGYIDKQVNSMANPQVISVSKYVKSSGDSMGPSASESGSTTTVKNLTSADITKIKNVKNVSKVDKTYTATNVTLKSGSKSTVVTSVGNWTSNSTTSSIVTGTKPGSGEIVLDKAAAKKINKNWKSLVGKTINFSYTTLDTNGNSATVKTDVKVSGIASASNSMGMASLTAINTSALTDAMKASNVSTGASTVAVKINKLANVTSTTKKINAVKSDSKRSFKATSIGSMIKTIKTYVSLASTVLSAIAAISLLVSALMIIVTMFMSVSSRTKEIGILRALGESKRDIRRLFISESVIIGLVSATLATGLAFGLGGLGNLLLSSIADYSFVQISFGNVVTAFVSALVISLLAAYLPARRAASLNPIDALSAD